MYFHGNAAVILETITIMPNSAICTYQNTFLRLYSVIICVHGYLYGVNYHLILAGSYFKYPHLISQEILI